MDEENISVDDAVRFFEDFDPEGVVTPHPVASDASAIAVRQLESNEEAGTTTFIASTDDEDRALDVVKQDWRLRNFRANPVILDNHHVFRVVGRAEDVRVPRNGDDAGSLVIRVAWDLDSPDPSIANVGRQHLSGMRRGGSVGFRSGRKTKRNELDKDHPKYREPEKFRSPWGFEFEHAGIYHEKNELFEFSSATIPMNPNALQKSWEQRSGATLSVRTEDVDFDFAAALLRRIIDDPAFAASLRGNLFSVTQFSDMLAHALPGVLRAPDSAEIRRVIAGILEARPPVAPEPRMVPGPGVFGALFPIPDNNNTE